MSADAGRRPRSFSVAFGPARLHFTLGGETEHMSMIVTKRVQLQALPKMVPRAFEHYCPGLRLAEPITLVVFDDSVVNSGHVRKAVRKLAGDSAACRLFVASDFTQEAREAIQHCGGEILARANFGWTDESHKEIRVFIGSKVKKPDWR